MSQPPLIPPYSPGPGSSSRTGGLLVGLVAGAAVSLVVWGVAWHATVESSHGPVWLIAIPLLKLVVAAALLAFARTRRVGAGLLISLALGFLIFFGSCFAHLGK